ncbi:hypothetical protein GCM10027174_40930 [Salinifilum aidingensis]
MTQRECENGSEPGRRACDVGNDASFRAKIPVRSRQIGSHRPAPLWVGGRGERYSWISVKITGITRHPELQTTISDHDVMFYSCRRRITSGRWRRSDDVVRTQG